MVALSVAACVEWKDAKCVEGRSCVPSVSKKNGRAMKIIVNDHELDVEEGDEVYVSELLNEEDEWRLEIGQYRNNKVIREIRA